MHGGEEAKLPDIGGGVGMRGGGGGRQVRRVEEKEEDGNERYEPRHVMQHPSTRHVLHNPELERFEAKHSPFLELETRALTAPPASVTLGQQQWMDNWHPRENVGASELHTEVPRSQVGSPVSELGVMSPVSELGGGSPLVRMYGHGNENKGWGSKGMVEMEGTNRLGRNETYGGQVAEIGGGEVTPEMDNELEGRGVGRYYAGCT